MRPRPLQIGFVSSGPNRDVINRDRPKASGPIEKLLLTESEAADLLGFSAGKLKGLRKAGQIGYVPSGRLIRYTREGLQAWINAQEVRCG